MTEITQPSLQLAQWCFLECEEVPQQAIFGRFLLGILVAEGSGLPLEGGTPVPDDHSCTKTGTVPGFGPPRGNWSSLTPPLPLSPNSSRMSIATTLHLLH